MLDKRTHHYFDVRGVTRVFDLTIDDSGWAMIRRDEDFWQRSAGRFYGTDARSTGVAPQPASYPARAQPRLSP